MAPQNTPTALIRQLQECSRRWPNAVLHRSPVGELNIVSDGYWVGTVQLMGDELFILDEPQPVDDGFAWAWYRVTR